jgi:uncharacterized protein YdhG (YjbR/CyaY superfamily)
MADAVDDYLAAQPDAARAVLARLRAIVHEEAPGVEETISYRMPTFVLSGRPLVHLAGWKDHVSLYPMPDGDPDLDRDAAPYVAGRGTVRFPLREPLPEDLVRRMVRALAARRA